MILKLGKFIFLNSFLHELNSNISIKRTYFDLFTIFLKHLENCNLGSTCAMKRISKSSRNAVEMFWPQIDKNLDGKFFFGRN